MALTSEIQHQQLMSSQLCVCAGATVDYTRRLTLEFLENFTDVT